MQSQQTKLPSNQSPIAGKQQQVSERSKKIIESFPQKIKQFYQFHGVQMIGSQLPLQLVETLYYKLQKGVYDAGQYFQINDNQDQQRFQVSAKQLLNANANIFLIDHALTYKYTELRSVLKKNPGIIDRLEVMLQYERQMKELPQNCQDKQEKCLSQNIISQNQQQIELEFDSMALTEIAHLEFSPNTITLSLMNNELLDQKLEEIKKKLEYLNLKVLWLNDNPIEQNEDLRLFIQKNTKIQLYNSKFTKNCTQWAIKYANNRNLKEAINPLNSHVYRLELDGRELFNIDLSLLKKFDKLSYLSLKEHPLQTHSSNKGQQTQQKKQNMQKQGVFLNSKQGFLWILKELKSLKYLFVDQQVESWLYEQFENKEISEQVAKRCLINKHSLFLRPQPDQMDYRIEEIAKCIMKISNCYRLANTEQLDESATWYVNDEVGTMIPHSDDGNVKIIPFLYAPNNRLDAELQSFSILWPLRKIQVNEFVCRDYLCGIKENRQRSSRLGIWYKLPEEYYAARINKFEEEMLEKEKAAIGLLSQFYQENSVKQREYFNLISEDDSFFPSEHRVITDHEGVAQYLTHEKFKQVKSIEDATVIWLSSAVDEQQWEQYKGKRFLNQFPYESCFVMKQNLAKTIQDVLGNTKFLMRTYDLEQQLAEFIGDFYEREKNGEDNLWIIKPPNMARSMDMIISDNLPDLIKSIQTGPKIAQKYITQPVLRQSRKVDLRYVLLVKSIAPLTLFLYKHFWIRSSNNPYTVDRRALNTYETQFTVMNYGNVTDFKQIPYKQFIQEFETTQSPTQWTTIHQKIKKLLRNTFIACGLKYPKMQEAKSRAIYGIDIMIDEKTMEPKLLEITFSPDCKRACEYYPSFYNEVFQTLFTDSISENMQRLI